MIGFSVPPSRYDPKGGHLPIAIQRVDQAISQVKLVMAAAGG